MSKKLAIAMFGQKRLSREGGVEIVVKELCTRMAQNGCDVTCYNRAGHHVSGAEYDDAGKTEYEGIRQKSVPTIERRGPASFVMPLQIGKTPIVVPRQHQFDEHVNDHQVDFSRNVAQRMGTIILVEDIPRIRVHWGGYSQIQVEMALLESALANGEYVRFHMLSGADMPLVTEKQLHAFFDMHGTTEFIHFDMIQDEGQIRNRLAQYHLLRDHIDRSQRILCGMEKAYSYIERFLNE